ncbi:MAG: tyrosine--tRNA ligase [Candidatus Nanoarchaeia archaeon]
MDIEKRLELIKRNTEEILEESDLRIFLETGEQLKHYIGFEISGFIHLGTGIASMVKVRDFQKAGVDCSIFLADWHSWINDKLGGNLEVIRKIAGGYFKEGIKASLKCVGGDPEKVKFVLGSELYHNNDEYWQTVIDISKNTTLARIMRSITIMGRKEGEAVDFAKLIYPSMQVADIFAQGINIAHAGLDQRKAHVVARDVALKLKIKPLKNKFNKTIKPIAIHHHLILGLGKPPLWPIPPNRAQELWSAFKMSKSIPNSAIFIHDSEAEIRKKVKNAFCQEKELRFNPILDWAKNLIFTNFNSFEIERPAKFGGNIVFESYDNLVKTYHEGKIHPLDLKNAVANYLIKLLEPARKHFEKPKIKTMKEELEKLKISR